jgi:hypothetical protein
MTVGMGVTMVMSVAVAVGVGRGHGKALYYNITSVHRLVCNCQQHYSSAPRKVIERSCCFARPSRCWHL